MVYRWDGIPITPIYTRQLNIIKYFLWSFLTDERNNAETNWLALTIEQIKFYRLRRTALASRSSACLKWNQIELKQRNTARNRKKIIPSCVLSFSPIQLRRLAHVFSIFFLFCARTNIERAYAWDVGSIFYSSYLFSTNTGFCARHHANGEKDAKEFSCSVPSVCVCVWVFMFIEYVHVNNLLFERGSENYPQFI